MKTLKKRFAIILAVCLIFCTAMPAYAVENISEETRVEETAEKAIEETIEETTVEEATEDKAEESVEEITEEVTEEESEEVTDESSVTEENTEVIEEQVEESEQLGSGEQHDNHDDITFEIWESSNSLPNEPGNYYLNAYVELSSTWNVPAGTTRICLNGQCIQASSTNANPFSAITVPDDAELIIYDCKEETDSGEGIGAIEGGYGTLINSKKYGGGVYVKNGGIFTMKKGVIGDNRSKRRRSVQCQYFHNGRRYYHQW